MDKLKESRARLIPQNMGWLDRLLRFIIGTTMLVVPITILVLLSDPEWFARGQAVSSWVYYLPLISILFFITAIFGTCPIYALLRIRSCGNKPRNPCGTFPFEVDAALGNKPIPDSDIEHSLAASHHK